MELDNDRYQTKVLEIGKDNKISFAYSNVENGTFLSEKPYPNESEVNHDNDICLQKISFKEFQRAWFQYVCSENTL